MKTMRFAVLLTFVAFATTIFASEHSAKKPVNVKISLEQALNHKSLSVQMFLRLDPGFLSVEKQGLYYTSLRLGNTTYVIFGKYKEWIAFFNLKKWRKLSSPTLGNERVFLD